MIRLLFLVVPLMFYSPLWAQSKTLAEISYKDSAKHHRFQLIEEKSAYKILFQENRSQPKIKTVSKSQSELLRRTARRIIWQAQFRKPAGLKSCSRYVSLKSGSDKADVCLEDTKATARSYGFLNALNRIFE